MADVKDAGHYNDRPKFAYFLNVGAIIDRPRWVVVGHRLAPAATANAIVYKKVTITKSRYQHRKRAGKSLGSGAEIGLFL